MKVCLAAYSLRYVRGGSYLWVFLNWALGLRACGCDVVWLDTVFLDELIDRVQSNVEQLRQRLLPFGFDRALCVLRKNGEAVDGQNCLALEEATDADLFLNLGYALHQSIVSRFARSVFIDIDPGLTQIWLSNGQLNLARHDMYLSYGETVANQPSLISPSGRPWQYIPPPVFLPALPVVESLEDAYFTTVTNWWGADWITIEDRLIDISKRTSFLEYADLPSRICSSLELAIPLTEEEDVCGDRPLLQSLGWSIRHVLEVSDSAVAYRNYVQQSRGEFSCLKHAYVHLQTAWTTERALNYLASGKPCLIQYAGPSRFLPDREGLLRFHNLEDAAQCFSLVERDYAKHCQAARSLVEDFFDAEKVIPRMLGMALG